MRLRTEVRRPVTLQLAVNIAVLAAIYALISCGYVLIYRVSRVLYLAHGELMMLGAYGLLADRVDVLRAPARRDRRVAASWRSPWACWSTLR